MVSLCIAMTLMVGVLAAFVGWLVRKRWIS
jgi:hypothetical protein